MRELMSYGMIDTKCYFCHQPFKPEDFSTIFRYRSDSVELLAHDDCLEEFTHQNKDLIWELGHKIWGDNDD